MEFVIFNPKEHRYAKQRKNITLNTAMVQAQLSKLVESVLLIYRTILATFDYFLNGDTFCFIYSILLRMRLFSLTRFYNTNDLRQTDNDR